MVENKVDVDRISVDRPLVGKYLHPVDHGHDPVGFLRNEARQGTILVGSREFQQLRRTPYAGKRILDLMSQHGGKAGYRASRPAMRHLAVDLVRHRPFLEHDHDRARKFRHRCGIEIHDLVYAEARRRDVHAILVYRGLALAHLVYQRQQRAPERYELVERIARKDGSAGAEKILGFGIGKGNKSLWVDHDDRPPDRVEHDLGGICMAGRTGDGSGRAHAALRISDARGTARKAARRPEMTSDGSVPVMIFLRRSGATPCTWRSRYQPRCFRACRRPLSTP